MRALAPAARKGALETDTTKLLRAMSQGDKLAAEELLPLVYDELRKLAAHRLANEAPGQTLQATALVHEAWLRLTGGDQSLGFENRGHFFAAAAESIRRILIERARKRGALKRRVELESLDLEHTNIAMETDDHTLLAVDDALRKLEVERAPAAELVKLRFYAGMTHSEACLVLNISERTAKRYWTFARAWLYQELKAAQAS